MWPCPVLTRDWQAGRGRRSAGRQASSGAGPPNRWAGHSWRRSGKSSRAAEHGRKSAGCATGRSRRIRPSPSSAPGRHSVRRRRGCARRRRTGRWIVAAVDRQRHRIALDRVDRQRGRWPRNRALKTPSASTNASASTAPWSVRTWSRGRRRRKPRMVLRRSLTPRSASQSGEAEREHARIAALVARRIERTGKVVVHRRVAPGRCAPSRRDRRPAFAPPHRAGCGWPWPAQCRSGCGRGRARRPAARGRPHPYRPPRAAAALADTGTGDLALGIEAARPEVQFAELPATSATSGDRPGRKRRAGSSRHSARAQGAGTPGRRPGIGMARSDHAGIGKGGLGGGLGPSITRRSRDRPAHSS